MAGSRRVKITRANRVALVACGIAAVCLAAEVWWDDPAPAPAPPAPAPQAQPSDAAATDAVQDEFTLKPVEDYAEMVERPLFVRGRRPPPPSEGRAGGQDGENETPAGQIALSGVLITGKHRVALLRLEGDPKVIHVSEGQEAGGWLLEKIDSDRVVLRRGDTSTEVVLDYRRRAADTADAARPGRGKHSVPQPGSMHGEPPFEEEDTGE